MTVQEAIRWIDEKRHNVYAPEDKLLWLSRVEDMARELAARHGLMLPEAPLEPETQLTIPEPYAQLYLHWLEAQVDYGNQEYSKYNNSMAMFNALWSSYANRFRRDHSCKPLIYRFWEG